MAPIGSGHAGTVMALEPLLARALGDRAIVLVQSPVGSARALGTRAGSRLLRPRQDFYRSGHPLPGDILLIIEVADTRLAYDRDVKIPLYARHGIPEVWLRWDLCFEYSREGTPGGRRTNGSSPRLRGTPP